MSLREAPRCIWVGDHGAHVVVSIKALKNGEFNPVITRSLAVPNGKMDFPHGKG